MIGILLLAMAICLFFNARQRKWSYFLYMFLMLNGFNIINSYVTAPFTTHDLALVYTALANVWIAIRGQWLSGVRFKYKRWFLAFVAFLALSSVYSYFHYGLTVYEIIQGGRYFYFVLALPVFLNMKEAERAFLIKALFRATLVATFVYLLQIVLGKSLIPGIEEVKVDSTAGFYRFGVPPPLYGFFLVLTFAKPKFFNKKYVKLYRLMFASCAVFCLSRTVMLTTLFSVLLVLYWKGQSTRIIKVLIVLSIYLVPFSDIVFNRFENGKTSTDLKAVLDGKFNSNYEMGENGTFTYRLAWVYERINYLVDRPIGEQIFGLGLMSDDSPKSTKLYHFRVNITFYDINYTAQLRTPDISYGTLVAYLGFIGMFIYLGFLLSMFIHFYKYRESSGIYLTAAVMLIIALILSFAGDTISNMQNLGIYFVCLAPVINKQVQ